MTADQRISPDLELFLDTLGMHPAFKKWEKPTEECPDPDF